jgi:predicted permease
VSPGSPRLLRWFRMLRVLFGRRRFEDSMSEELASHLALYVDDLVRAGMTRDDAVRHARMEFGQVDAIRADCRAARRVRWIDDAVQDLRYALRLLARSPGFTIAAVWSLALGIGGATAGFSVLNALVLRPLPVASPHELVVLKRLEGPAGEAWDFAHPWFERIRERAGTATSVLSGVAASWVIERAGATLDRQSALESGRQLRISLTSGTYFPTLGVRPHLGRLLAPDDDRAIGGSPVAVVSHEFWRRRAGQRPDIVGRTLRLHATTYTIVGVAPPGFTGLWVGQPTDVWLPYVMASQVMPEVPGGPARFPAVIVGRLRAGVDRGSAEAALLVTWRHALMLDAGTAVTPEQRAFIASRRLVLESGAAGYAPMRSTLLPSLAIIMAVVVVTLLTTCANVANLLIARAVAREREMQVRLALGAGRPRLTRQLLTESLLLSLLGGAAGVVLAFWTKDALVAVLASGVASVGVDAAALTIAVPLDLRVLGVAFGLCVLTGVGFGLSPTRRSARAPIAALLTTRGGTRSATGRFSLANALVVLQVGLSTMLVIAAGLFGRSLLNLRGESIGFDRDHLLLVKTAPVRTGRVGPSLVALADDLRARLAALPGVEAVSVSNGGVLEGGDDRGRPSEEIRIEGAPAKPGLRLRTWAVAPQFFSTVGLPLIAGRDFGPADTATSPRVAVVSERVARFFFGDANPIGRRLTPPIGDPVEIVGVVGNAKGGTLRDVRGAWYVPFTQDLRALRLPWSVVIRAAGDPAALVAPARQALLDLDPHLPILGAQTIDDQVADALAQDRLMAGVALSFGMVAVVLASLGVYGIVAYATVRRGHEIGIRMALGATRRRIVGDVARDALVLGGLGVALGVPVAGVAGRLIGARLFGVAAMDPTIVAAAVAGMLSLTALAAIAPARRASRVSALTALRAE